MTQKFTVVLAQLFITIKNTSNNSIIKKVRSLLLQKVESFRQKMKQNLYNPGC